MTPFKRVTIIGVGLMGGSFALGLRNGKLAREVIGFGRNKQKLEIAKKKGVIDDYTLDIKHAVQSSDLILISTPVGSINHILDDIETYCKCETIVMDVGSTKRDIVSCAQKIFSDHIKFVGAHPLAGSDNSGVCAAKGDLYSGKKCIITPVKSTDSDALRKMKNVWRALGSSVFLMQPSEHDNIVAQTSHLPHIIAASLVRVLAKNKSKFIASGFKDTTRIAKSEPNMWADICIANKKAITREIDAYLVDLKKWKRDINILDRKKLVKVFEQIKIKREKLD